MKRYSRVLSIAGSDSGGGAGIQADIKTITVLGGYAMAAITAITAQNTMGISAIYPVPISAIKEQLDAVLSDIGTDAVKIGMLHSPEVIYAVAQKLKEYQVKNIVLDPVMVATSGDRLLKQEAISALKTTLFPIANLITPNVPEAEVLLNRKLNSITDMELYITHLGQWESEAVLLKGGHLPTDFCADLLFIPSAYQVYEFSAPKISTQNTHGTGCTLSAAIAVFLAHQFPLQAAVQAALDYLRGAILSGKDYTTGNGNGPVFHNYKLERGQPL